MSSCSVFMGKFQFSQLYPHFPHLCPSHWRCEGKICGKGEMRNHVFREMRRPVLWTIIWSDNRFWWRQLSWITAGSVGLELCGNFCWIRVNMFLNVSQTPFSKKLGNEIKPKTWDVLICLNFYLFGKSKKKRLLVFSQTNMVKYKQI